MPARVVLVRQPPGGPSDRTLGAVLQRASGQAGETLLFLHGDAVDRATGREPVRISESVSVAVCQSSWARRYARRPVPAPARTATLAGLLEALEQAPHLICLGIGGESSGPPTPRPAEPLLIEIGFEPRDARGRREALDIALAVAALGLDGRVLFSGPGYNHVLTEDARAWAQLTDFELLELVWTAPPSLEARVPVQRIDADRAARLRAKAGRHLLL